MAAAFEFIPGLTPANTIPDGSGDLEVRPHPIYKSGLLPEAGWAAVYGRRAECQKMTLVGAGIDCLAGTLAKMPGEPRR